MNIMDVLVPEAISAAIARLVELAIEKFGTCYRSRTEDLKDISDILNRYLVKCYNISNSMSTIVFRNQPKTLEELYIPLTIVQELFPPQIDAESYTLNFRNIDYIDKYQYLKIVDTAGMGKSTLIKFIAMQTIASGKYIPVIIELRRITHETDILQFIMDQMGFLNERFSRQDIVNLIMSGDLLFLFDGYDEIPEIYKDKVTEKVQDFLKQVENNHVVISSRKEEGLDCFDGFQTFSISPLSDEEAYDLIRKYDNEGERGEELIAAIQENANLTLLHEFLTNPLMVSLLYKAYSYKPDIPYKKFVFYDQVYAALFEEHDFTKGGAFKRQKKSGLDMGDFKRVLNRLGFYCAKKNMVEFTREELLSVLREIISAMPDLSVKPGDFQQDLVTTVPLFVQESGKYRWVHKSFYEYFAACFIKFDAKEKQDKLITQMANIENFRKFENILDFCYDMDIQLAEKNIVLPFLESFIAHYKASYQFLEPNVEESDMLKLAVLKSVSYFCDYGLIVSESKVESVIDHDILNGHWLMGNYTTPNRLYVSPTCKFKPEFSIAFFLFIKNVDIFHLNIEDIEGEIKFNDVNLPIGAYLIADDSQNTDVINALIFSEDNDYFKRICISAMACRFILDIDKCVALKDQIEKNLAIDKMYWDNLDI